MYMEKWKEREKIYACWLCNFPYIGNGKLCQLAEMCGGPEGVYQASPKVWGSVLSSEQVERLKEYTAKWRPKQSYEKMREQGIDIVTIRDAEYPGRLKYLPDAPYGLFVRGRLAGEEEPSVAVVGARECSEYGRYVARQLGIMLGKCNITVVSGMARGIDGISQEAALEAGGISIGVLGSGVDVCYPSQNRELYQRLVKEGALVSAYPLGTPARPRNFPPRNRIVSGLADVVVVVEARMKSGTLITVDMALEQGKEVYVAPGRVTDRLSDGCNRLIKQGAGVLLAPDEFVEEIWAIYDRKNRRGFRGGEGVERDKVSPHKDLPNMSGDTTRRDLPPELAAVCEALDFTPRSPEEIRGKSPTQYQKVSIVACLMKLCVEQRAVQVSPGRFARRSGAE